MSGERHIQLVPNCTCDASGVVVRHSPDCEVARAGLDLLPAPTPEQVETLALAVLHLQYRYNVPTGKQRITAEKAATIKRAVEIAEDMLGPELRTRRW